MARASLLLVLLALGSTHAGLNDLHEKDSVEKKDRDKKDFHRYEDWGMDWSDADMMQHPIDEGPRRIDRILGDICSYSRDCASGCCLMDRSTRQRTCQPLAGWGDKCSMGQVKGDLYVDACPCKAGPDVCTFPAGVCSK